MVQIKMENKTSGQQEGDNGSPQYKSEDIDNAPNINTPTDDPGSTNDVHELEKEKVRHEFSVHRHAVFLIFIGLVSVIIISLSVNYIPPQYNENFNQHIGGVIDILKSVVLACLGYAFAKK